MGLSWKSAPHILRGPLSYTTVGQIRIDRLHVHPVCSGLSADFQSCSGQETTENHLACASFVGFELFSGSLSVCRSRPLFIFTFFFSTDALMFACRIYQDLIEFILHSTH